MPDELNIQARLKRLAGLKTPPGGEELSGELAAINGLLAGEDPALRPPDARGLPGGLVIQEPNLPTMIIPDLHGRRGFLLRLLPSPCCRDGVFSNS